MNVTLGVHVKFQGCMKDNASETKKMQTNQPGLPYAVVTGGHICKALLPCGVIQEEVHLAEKRRNVKRFPGRPKDGVSMLEYPRVLILAWRRGRIALLKLPGKHDSFASTRKPSQDWIHQVFQVLWELIIWKTFPWVTSVHISHQSHFMLASQSWKDSISFVGVNSWENSIKTLQHCLLLYCQCLSFALIQICVGYGYHHCAFGLCQKCVGYGYLLLVSVTSHATS